MVNVWLHTRSFVLNCTCNECYTSIEKFYHFNDLCFIYGMVFKITAIVMNVVKSGWLKSRMVKVILS